MGQDERGDGRSGTSAASDTWATWPAEEGPPSDPVEPPVGEARYAPTDDGLLGRGGLGEVRLVHDRVLGRAVARKHLRADVATRSGGVDARVRFLREARVTAALEHPGIVPIYELGTDQEGRPWYTMRRIRGRTLGQALAEAPDLTGRLALLGPLVACCQAVAYAHQNGVVHRDLKPANVMVGAFGETVVLDWGLARFRDEDLAPGEAGVELRSDDSQRTIDGAVMGTPAYMSPEQARGALADLDARSDVWSLGAILYELLTGSRAFAATHAAETLGRVLRGDRRAVLDACPEVPADLAAICERALALDPDERFPTAAELAEELERWRNGVRVHTYAYSPRELLLRTLRRHRLVVGAIGLGAIIAASSAVLSYGEVVDERDLARAAEAEAEARTVDLLSSLASRAWEEGDCIAARRYAAEALAAGAGAEARGVLLGTTSCWLPRLRWAVPGPGRAHGLAALPDGDLVLTGDQGLVRMDPITGAQAPFAPVDGATGLHARGDLVAATTSEGELILLDAAGRELARRQAHSQTSWAVAVAPDGRTVASAGGDHLVRLWSVPDLALLAESDDHHEWVYGLAWVGDQLWSAGSDDLVHIRDPVDLRTLATTGADRSPLFLAASSDGRVVASSTLARARATAWEAGDPRRAVDLPGLRRAGGRVAVSPDGSLVAALTTSAEVLLWRPDGRLLARLPAVAQGRGLWLGHGDQLVVTTTGGQALAWSLPGSERTLPPGEAAVAGLGFDEDGLWSVTFDGWLHRALQPVARLPGTHTPHAIRVGEALVLARDLAGEVVACDGEGRACRSAAVEGHPTRLAAGPGGQRVAVGLAEGIVELRAVDDLALLARWAVAGRVGEQAIIDLAWEPDGILVGTAGPGVQRYGEDGVARASPGPDRGRYSLLARAGGVLATCAYPDGLVLTGLEGGEQRAWPTEDQGCNAVALDPGGEWVASGGEDGTVRIWSLPGGEALAIVPAHRTRVQALATDGAELVSGDWTGEIRRVDLAWLHAPGAQVQAEVAAETGLALEGSRLVRPPPSPALDR